MMNTVPVSYTHLDVYKRQTLEDMGLEVERLCPVRKDWNDDLCAKFERKEN